jgi:hypothetical protein
MADEALNRAAKLVGQLYEKQKGNMEALFAEFAECVRADPSLGNDAVAPAFERVVKSELLKRGALPHWVLGRCRQTANGCKIRVSASSRSAS